ncbi:MAG: hypothetical protein R2697_08065 [Ilumatobacteraceae bacterium]
MAIVTPLPPQRTGIADYSAFVFPALERYFDVGYVVNSLDEVAAGIGPRRDETITTGLVGRFDHVLHVLGNSHFHVPALEHLQRLGGAALGHDNRMSGAYLHWRGAAATARVMSMHGADIAEPDVYRYLVDLDGAPDSCYGEIAEWARPLFVHSESPGGQAERRDGHDVLALPFCPLRVPSARRSARTPTSGHSQDRDVRVGQRRPQALRPRRGDAGVAPPVGCRRRTRHGGRGASRSWRSSTGWRSSPVSPIA